MSATPLSGSELRHVAIATAHRLNLRGAGAVAQVRKLIQLFDEAWVREREREAVEAFAKKTLLARQRCGRNRSLGGTFFAAAAAAARTAGPAVL